MKDPGYCLCSDCEKCRDTPGISCPRTVLLTEIAGLKGELEAVNRMMVEMKGWKAKFENAVKVGAVEFLRAEQAEAERDKLLELAYIGEHYHDDNTYKSRLEELVPHLRKLEQELEEVQKESDENLEALRVLGQEFLQLQREREENAVFESIEALNKFLKDQRKSG